ncbi:hypothetical protein [Bacillus sp. SD088]|uniref:hypothetical protein n=1 Tax=Bacillus sp. SD088 TaxID=2782012 RepID=UPI001F61ACF0|nr:hypothetical protein [Bacillus sp. SD088]
MKVKLEDVLEAIESASDEFEYYYNTESGEIIMYGDSMHTGIDQSDFLEDLEDDEDNKYIELPSKFEINDYHIMRHLYGVSQKEKSKMNWRMLSEVGEPLDDLKIKFIILV